MMCVLRARGAPKGDVVAFLSPIPPMPVLSAHLSLPELKIPEDYEECLMTSPGPLSDAVGARLIVLFTDPTVATVVLTYENHGPKASPGEGERPLTAEMFKGWALVAASLNKCFLVVLDTCYSTYFATTMWRDLMALTAEFHDRLSACAGSLTSSDVGSYVSRILISKNRELVYRLDDAGEFPEGGWVRSSDRIIRCFCGYFCISGRTNWGIREC
jgi:hypothetical protein